MKKGITLIEILVTSLILSMSIATMMFSFVVCQRIIIRNTHKNNATLIINQHFEEILRCNTEFALNEYLTFKGLNNGINVQKSYYKGGMTVYQNYFVTIRQASVIQTTTGANISMLVANVTWSTSPKDRQTMFVFSNEPI
jgi:type II secretory pathway pseudopilin PulG